MTDLNLPQYGANFSYNEDGTSGVKVYIKDGDTEKVVFEMENVSSDDAQSTVDEFVKSQGWETHAEAWSRCPLRYKMWIDEDPRDESSTFCDQVCTDRLTGKEVFRYDLGDPANNNSEYGGISDWERFERRKLNRPERVSIDDCVVKN
jgi:hypothetical protein